MYICIYVKIRYLYWAILKKEGYSHNSFLCIQLIEIPKAINGENGYV